MDKISKNGVVTELKRYNKAVVLFADGSTATANNRAGAVLGDSVQVEISKRGLLRAMCSLYGIPFLAMLVSFSVSNYIIRKTALSPYCDIISFAIGLACVGVAILFMLRRERRYTDGLTLINIVKTGDEKCRN